MIICEELSGNKFDKFARDVIGRPLPPLPGNPMIIGNLLRRPFLIKSLKSLRAEELHSAFLRLCCRSYRARFIALKCALISIFVRPVIYDVGCARQIRLGRGALF